MPTLITPRLDQKIARQRELVPVMYAQFDFAVPPERFTQDLSHESTLPRELSHTRARLLADVRRVELMRAYTLIGDDVADAYAALMPSYGARRLIGMLDEACKHGLDQVVAAPPELARDLASHIPMLKDAADQRLVQKLIKQLGHYGHAEYSSHAESCHSAPLAAAR